MKIKYTYIAIAIFLVAIFILVWNFQSVRLIENQKPLEDTSLIEHSEIPNDSD